MSTVFLNFHHHDEFSLMDAIDSVDNYASWIARQGGRYCVVTNHGSIGGWLRQRNACLKHKLKPIYGMEAYVETGVPKQKRAHLILIALNNEGAGNIIELHNLAQRDGKSGRFPTVKKEWFDRLSGGIACLSACSSGEVAKWLLLRTEEGYKQAEEVAKWYASVFKDRYYLELTMADYVDGYDSCDMIAELAAKLGIPTIATLDSHYITSSQHEAHKMLIKMRYGKVKSLSEAGQEEESDSYSNMPLHCRTHQDTTDLFHAKFERKYFNQEVWDNCVKNANELAERIDWVWFDNSLKMPTPRDCPSLQDSVDAGRKTRGIESLPADKQAVYMAREQKELEVIYRLGWEGYLRLIADVCRYTRAEHGAMTVAWGRGSSAGSLLCYYLGITEVDPIKYQLLFERFLDESRGGTPFCSFDTPPLTEPTEAIDWIPVVTPAMRSNIEVAMATVDTPEAAIVFLESIAVTLGLRVLQDWGDSTEGIKERLDDEIKELQSNNAIGRFTSWDIFRRFQQRFLDSNSVKISANPCSSVLLWLVALSGKPAESNFVKDKMYCDSVPDIDTDFAASMKDVVRKYVVDKYGKENVCAVGTYQSYKIKSVLLDICKAKYGDEEKRELQRITAAIEAGQHANTGDDDDLEDDGAEKRFDQLTLSEIMKSTSPELLELQNWLQQRKELVVLASNMRALRGSGQHPAGVIISDSPLMRRLPMSWIDGSLLPISQWIESGSEAELTSIGFVKYDFLSSVHLDLLHGALTVTGLAKSFKDLDDPRLNKAVAKCAKSLGGIFQLSKGWVETFANAVKLESIDDISALSALLRPGASQAEVDGIAMPMAYARRKNGQDKDWGNSTLGQILPDTYGLIVYQEDFMRVARDLAGFSPPKTNKLRKAAGKKKAALMASLKADFISGCAKVGKVSPPEAEKVWADIERFGGYGFCKAHAVAYAYVSAAEMLVKSERPGEFFAERFNGAATQKDCAAVVDDLRKSKLRLRLKNVCVNESRVNAAFDGKGVRMGLRSIKGVASWSVRIVNSRPNGGYKSVTELLEKSATRTVIETNENLIFAEAKKEKVAYIDKTAFFALAKSGAMDCLADPAEDEPVFQVRERLYKIATAAFQKINKNAPTIETAVDSSMEEEQIALTGLCLGFPSLMEIYEDDILEANVKVTSELSEITTKGGLFLCRIEDDVLATSKAGNDYRKITVSDCGRKSFFFVWQSNLDTWMEAFGKGIYGSQSRGKICVVRVKKMPDNGKGGESWCFSPDRSCSVILMED